MIHPSITIQGNIISGEILEKIGTEEITHQTPASFGLERNARVRDEIGLAWSTIRGLWHTFRIRKERLSDQESGTTETRNFWMFPFLTTLGYDVEKATAEVFDGKSYAISHRATNLQGFPVHITGINDSLDKRRETSGPRLSPHALVQEYLNKTDDHLYAIVTNGSHLRLLRDTTRLVRLTYLEFDLEKMMEEELFSDFALLFRLLHASRMPQVKGDGENSIMEKYHQASLEAGTRIREKLRDAVEYAIKQLANGFLQHPENESLRQEIREVQLSPNDFYLQSLRLVYRTLFLLVIEDRGLVYPDKLDEEGKKLRQIYLSYYSMNRLRQLAGRKRFVEPGKQDLWENLKVAFRLFEDAQYAQKLGLQPLGSGIFAPDALGSLAETHLNNNDLLEVMQRICYFDDRERQMRVKVNYGDLDVEEFGSVYEGLLEYKPVFTENNGKLQFDFEPGSERSSSGSHYTPEELVRPLIKHSLDYIIDDCLKKPHERLNIEPGKHPLKALQEKALLDVKVADVACGSGHILLSAARRMATELARVRTGEDQPSPRAIRHAIRDVIRHCIYGVDKNPLAVELCKVALWLEAHNPGEPLNFLDHKIKCGDSIVGLAHRDELENGIASEAFKTLPGDEKEVAASLRKRNNQERKEREGKMTQLKADFEATTSSNALEAMGEYVGFVKMPESTPDEIARKEKAYQRYLDGRGHQWLKLMADLQVAQFFLPKTVDKKEYLLTDAPYRQILAGYQGWQNRPAAKATVLAREKVFFHWFIEFPEVFEKGGFDCVLGNPPFLGDRRLKEAFGENFLEWIRYKFTPDATVDLVVYFFLRIFSVIKKYGFQSLISTNTVAQGKAREFGLEKMLTNGATINHAVKSMKWPGLAAVEVSLVTVFNGLWNKKYFLNGKKTAQISPFLDEADNTGTPYPLAANDGKSYQGSIILGMGFVLEKSEATSLMQINPRNTEVIAPYLNGDDLNNSPAQKPSRFVINFFDWSENKAADFNDVFEIVVNKVKPERQRWKEDKQGNQIIGEYALRKPLPQKWWQHAERRPALYSSLENVKRVLVSCRVSKYVNQSFIETGQIFDVATSVVVRTEYWEYAFLQCSLHNIWAWKYASTLESRIRYVNVDCIDTYPILEFLSEDQKKYLESLGETYHEHRRQLMLSMQLGLTKTYNAFHAPDVQPGITTAALHGKDKKAIEKQYSKEVWNLWNHLQKTTGTCTLEEAIAGITKLRQLHIEMDNAVLEAYGWSDIDLRHDFYEVDYLPENDRIRFTIHPDVRKEVLKRLLELNHRHFEEEASQGLHKEETVRKFYEQKGQPVPVEVSKWFIKGKKRIKPTPPIQQLNEPDSAYGGLFDQGEG